MRAPRQTVYMEAMTTARGRWSFAGTIIVVGLFAAPPAHAAEIGCASFYGDVHVTEESAQKLWLSGTRPTAATCKIGSILGEIVKGDYEKFLTFYRPNHPFLEQVALDLPGGNADEAIKIGQLFRKYLITAVSPSQLTVGNGLTLSYSYRTGKLELCDGPDCMCASACALIWFGAPDRSGRIGLHRPRTDDRAFKSLAPADAAVAYKQMLQRIVSYLEAMETPRPLIDAMVSTSSAEIRWFEDKTAEDRAPSFAEWVDASCGRLLSPEEYSKMMRLDAKQLKQSLLYQKYHKKIDCETQLISSNRDQIPRP